MITVVKEREDELTKKTLQALNDMRIKFPGKTDQEAELILDTVSLLLQERTEGQIDTEILSSSHVYISNYMNSRLTILGQPTSPNCNFFSQV